VSLLLRDEVLARRLARAGRAALADYTWPAIAARTVTEYRRAVREERTLRDDLRRTQAPLRMVVRDGNLLASDTP
jgi:hypothetical protein